MNSHDMYILLHAKQEMVSSEIFSTLGKGQWRGKRDEKHGLKSLVSCRSQERYNNEGLFPWAGTRHLTERSNRSGLHPGVPSSVVEIGR